MEQSQNWSFQGAKISLEKRDSHRVMHFFKPKRNTIARVYSCFTLPKVVHGWEAHPKYCCREQIQDGIQWHLPAHGILTPERYRGTTRTCVNNIWLPPTCYTNSLLFK